MNKYLKEIILEIMDVAIDINTYTPACTFVEYSGHVDVLKVYVYLNGDWKGKADMDKFISCQNPSAEDELMAVYKRLNGIVSFYQNEEEIKNELQKI